MRLKSYFVRGILSAAMAAALLLCSCRGYEQIPEDTLAEIFKDMFVLNAYIDRNSLNLQLDSVDIYGPLIEKYGYTTRDFTNTITDATKRKSFRLADIVEAATEKMVAEQAALAEKIRISAKIDSTALAFSRHEVYRDSLISLRSMADSVRMKVSVPLEEAEGKIEISYYYTLDSLDRNKDLSNRHVLRNAEGITRSSSTLRLLPKSHAKHTTTLTALNDVAELEITFGNYPPQTKKMHLDIDSLVVVHQPTLAKSYEIISREYTYRLIIDGKEYNEYFPPKKSVGSLYLLSPLVDPQRDSLLVE